MKLSDNWVAVGTAAEKDRAPCVVVIVPGFTIQLPEHTARKLADDILRNANYLWPIDEEDT